jgi:hypothetical protein
MAFYHQFDLTASSISLGTTDTVSDDGYDLSEFDGDSRGTARVADWSDIESIGESDYDVFLEVLGLVNNSTFYVSYNNRNGWWAGNKYYWDSSINRPFWCRANPSSSGGWHDTNLITGSLYQEGSKNIVLGSWSPANLKCLVFFPSYEPNGGHESLTVTF